MNIDPCLIEGPPRTAELLPVHRRFEERVAEHPEAPALTFEGATLTYGELNRWADAIAAEILSVVEQGARVGILLDRSLPLVPTVLGVLKAGCVCVPLSPDHPEDKLEFMIRHADVSLVAGSHHPGLVSRLECRHLSEEALIGARSRSVEFSGMDSEASDIAYILYTSGTTGSPKGVMLPHSGIDNHILWKREFYRATTDDVFILKTPIGFDISVWETFFPLTVGARLVVASPQAHLFLRKLRQQIVEEGVTIVHFVGTVLRLFLDLRQVESCTSLRAVICGGEAWTMDLMRRGRAKLPAADFFNGYGPAEACLGTTTWKCDESLESGSMPLGTPVYGTDLLILDKAGQPVRDEGVGELHIVGDAVGAGYYRNEQLTRERFVELPSAKHAGRPFYRTGDLVRRSGDHIYFQGRADNQVKIGGVRVDLEEVEEIVCLVPGVEAACVVVLDGAGESSPQLRAFIVADETVSDEVIVAQCQRRLSSLAVPSIFDRVPSLPVTVNGKLDRAKVRALAVAGGHAPSAP